MTLSHFEGKWQNDWKWHKMTLKMIEKDMNEWNWLKTSEKKWKGLEIIKNDKVSSWEKMTKNDWKWH